MNTNPTFIERYALPIFLILTPLISLAIPFYLSLPTELVPLLMIFVPAFMAVLLTSLGEGRKGLAALLKKPFQWQIGFKWYAITLGLALGLRLTMSALAVLLGWIPTIQLNSWSPRSSSFLLSLPSLEPLWRNLVGEDMSCPNCWPIVQRLIPL